MGSSFPCNITGCCPCARHCWRHRASAQSAPARNGEAGGMVLVMPTYRWDATQAGSRALNRRIRRLRSGWSSFFSSGAPRTARSRLVSSPPAILSMALVIFPEAAFAGVCVMPAAKGRWLSPAVFLRWCVSCDGAPC